MFYKLLLLLSLGNSLNVMEEALFGVALLLVKHCHSMGISSLSIDRVPMSGD